MKIYIISRGYPTQDDPQWGCFEKDQAIALQKLGHEIIFLSLDRRFSKKNILKKGVFYKKENHFHIYNYKTIIPGALLQYISEECFCNYYSLKLLDLFEHVVREQGLPDILFVHYLSNIAFAKKIKEKYHIPVVGMEHWSVINQNPLPKYVLNRGRIAYTVPDMLLSVSNSLHNRIKTVWNKDSIVVHNMVGGEFEYKVLKKKSSDFQFVSIGSLIHRKGFDLLIEAFSQTGLKDKKVRLIIIGEGKDKLKLQTLIKNKGLDSNVELVGSKNKAEIVDLLLQSDAFVLPSRSETFGVVYIEAMMLGLPVIGTICGGPEEFITEQNGILINSEDMKALSKALQSMYNNISFYDKEKIVVECRNNFSPSVISQQLIEIFNKVTNKR